jgi:hypothetical protein
MIRHNADLGNFPVRGFRHAKQGFKEDSDTRANGEHLATAITTKRNKVDDGLIAGNPDRDAFQVPAVR